MIIATVFLASLLSAIALVCLVFAWPFIWLWNYAVVGALDFALPIESFWVGFWLLFFISVFFARNNSK